MNRQRFNILVLLISLTMVLTLSIDRISVRASGELNTEPDDDYFIYLPLISGQPKPSSCTPDPAGESDNINDALTVCSGQTVSGQVSDDDWDDVYKILTVANQQLTLSMNGSGGDADLYLFPPGTSNVFVKGPILVPFESGQITVVLGHTGRVAHHLMPHVAGLHCIPPANLL